MRILVVKLSSIGDIFHAIPTVAAIKKATGAEIEWVTQAAYAELVRCFDDVSRVYSVKRHSFLRSLLRLRRELSGCRYDVVVDLQGLMKSALVVAQAQGNRKLGPSYRREASGFFYHECPEPRDTRIHAVDECMDVLPLLAVARPAALEWPVSFPNVSLSGRSPKVGLLPVSRWASKNWPLAHYVAFAKALRAERPECCFFILGGSGDAAVGQQIKDALPFDVENLCGVHSLPETGGVIQGLDLLVAGDSGPTHMAAAAGTRALVLYGPTTPGRTGPYGAAHRVIEADMDCRPCRRRHCKRRPDCMQRIRPEWVLDAAVEMLRSAGM